MHCQAVDGSYFRLRPEHRDHVWSYDFVHCRTDDGKAFRTLNIVDEYSRECLAIRVDRKLNSGNVIDALSDLFILRGIPSFIRSDNGPKFVAQAVRDWIEAVGPKTAYIEPFVGELIPQINSRSSLPLGERILRELQCQVSVVRVFGTNGVLN
jgi:transposase InsO family protein